MLSAKDQDRVKLTGVERKFDTNELIVSKTDPRGIMTYVNPLFIEVSGYTEAELIEKPHSLIRHPAMPRCVFRLLWDTVKSGKEIFAYVVNRCKNGDHYWVLAHVTPTLGQRGEVVGYHSSRRSANRKALQAIEPLYAELLAIEQQSGMDKAAAHLAEVLKEKDIGYDKFMFALQRA